MKQNTRFEAYPRESELGNFLTASQRTMLASGLPFDGKAEISTLDYDPEVYANGVND